MCRNVAVAIRVSYDRCRAPQLKELRWTEHKDFKVTNEVLRAIRARAPRMGIIENVLGLSHTSSTAIEMSPLEYIKQSLTECCYAVAERGTNLNFVHAAHRPRTTF